MATSTILCNKQHFLSIGGFNEDFIGHMGEDLELLNRLALNYRKYDFEEDHIRENASKNPKELIGYRRHFARYSLPHLKKKAYTVHLYHSTRLGSRYKKANLINQAKLLEVISTAQYPVLKSVKPLSLPSYLNSTPPSSLTKTERFFKKTRKLFRSPKQFFRDIK